MKGRHAAGGWSPFRRDIVLRSVLALLLAAMVVFIWWLFSEDDPFTLAVPTTSGEETTVTSDAVTTPTEPGAAPTTATTRASTPSTTAGETTTSSTAVVTTTAATIPPPLDPSQLVVGVFNANGVPGVAGRTTALMEEAGYGVTAPDNHAQRLDVSRVWYRDDLSREATVIKEAWIPDALLEAIPLEQEGIDIVVILGRSFEE